MKHCAFYKSNGEKTSVSLTDYQYYVVGLLAKREKRRILEYVSFIARMAEEQNAVNVSGFIRDYIIESLVIMLAEKGVYL